jgi:hypothetical protein
LACALAADTPTIIAKTLSPAIKARFISLPPFRQTNATLFIGSINNNKIKEADARGRPIFLVLPRKIFINARSFFPPGTGRPARITAGSAMWPAAFSRE